MDTKKHKCLIVYFSRTGYNYIGGSISRITVGNTEVVARKIGVATGGDLAQILPMEEYPSDYHETTKKAQAELKGNIRPPFSIAIENLEEYDVIFLGYPNWWGTMPMPVWTFLERYGFSGKTIIPFCTHEGSGMGHSERDIATLCPQARLLKGLAIQGTNSGTSGQLVQDWIRRLDI